MSSFLVLSDGDTRNRWRDGQVCPDVGQGTMAPWARQLGGEGGRRERARRRERRRKEKKETAKEKKRESERERESGARLVWRKGLSPKIGEKKDDERRDLEKPHPQPPILYYFFRPQGQPITQSPHILRTNQKAVTQLSLVHPKPSHRNKLFRTNGSANQEPPSLGMKKTTIIPTFTYRDYNYQMLWDYTLGVSLLADHLVGTSAHAPQRPMVTFTEMGTVGL
ncbi:hypothetical protein TNCV_4535801 [Trichonephila clavipes]|nr:hypothetical protein TNCV_4535801 [Trichonephila clavipes]